MNYWRHWLALVTTVALVIDWGTKVWAIRVGDGRHQFVDPQVNDAYALSTVSGPSVVLALVSIVVLTIIIRYTAQHRAEYHAGGVGLLLGGGLANGLERLVSGAVTDFIVVGPVVVNLADVAIVIGIGILTIDYARANLRRALISAG